MSWFTDAINEHPELVKKAVEETEKENAKIKAIKLLDAKDTPISLTWYVEFSDYGSCPICGEDFNFEIFYSKDIKETRCPKCNQLFSIGTYIT